MTRPDDFAGRVPDRLARVNRIVRDVGQDAQVRDWVAERPDPVGFARLGQVHYEVATAIRRYTRGPAPVEDWTPPLVGMGAWMATTALILLLAPAPAAPVPLAGALVAGMVTGQAATSLLHRVRDRRAWRAGAGPAPIDDPALYADLTRRIEACAASARSDPDESRRAAADDLGRATGWVSATANVG
jgi:hypothetical protein